ncbi:MAG: hypothetical protein ACM65M_06835 [Microcoleus sp.]
MFKNVFPDFENYQLPHSHNAIVLMYPQRAIALIVLSSARSNNEMMEWSIDFHNPQGMNISSNSPYTC